MSLGRSCEKEERFLHPGKPPHRQGDGPGQKESFRASEEKTAAGLQQPKQREDCTVSQCCCLALPSLTNKSASAGRGWVLELGLQRSEPGRGLGLARCADGLGGLESSVITAGGVRRGSLGHLRGQSSLFGGCTRGGVGSGLQPFSLCVRLQRAGHHLHGLQEQSQCPPPTPRHQEWFQATITSLLDPRRGCRAPTAARPNSRSGCEMPSRPCALGVCPSCPPPPRTQDWASATASAHPHQGDNDQHTLKRKSTGIHTKNCPRTKYIKLTKATQG